MAKMKRYMALDFGIGNGVAMAGAFDGEKLELEPMHRFVIRATSMLNVSYWDFPSMLIHAKQGLYSFTARHGSDLAGVGCNSWASDFGLLDKTGHLLANPVHYLDGRTRGTQEKLNNVFPVRSLYQRNGICSRRMSTLNQLYAMALANNPLLDKAVTMLLLADLVSYFLTGTPVQEYTLASTTGMYDAESLDWSRDIILGAKIPPGMVPEIVAPGTVIGPLLDSVAAECGLAQTPVIAPASHGLAGALAAVPAKGENWASVTLGYWCQVAAELSAPIINDASFSAGFSNLGGVDGSIRLQKEALGLGVVDECMREWSRREGRELSMEEVMEGAREAPALTRLVNPDDPRIVEAADKTAILSEMLAETDQPALQNRSELIRMYLESLVLGIRRALARLTELTGVKYDVIHFVGRGCAYDALAQAIADATGKTVKTGPVEAKAVGNIVMQMMALGDVGSLSEARELVASSFPVKEFAPNDDKGKWQEAYKKFQDLR